MSEHFSSHSTLLRSKLMPPRLNASIIPRPILLAQLDQSLQKKLTLVTAPTGYGKTTSVSLWLENRKIPSTWVTLDETDNDPVRFWTYVTTALRALNPIMGKKAISLLSGSQIPSFQELLVSLINDLQKSSHPSILVLEDFHTILEPEIKSSIGYLLQYLPPSLHLIFISRLDPDLPLGILRVRDELLEIESDLLRFSLEEAGQLFRNLLPVPISPPVLKQLLERTDGWPAGLRLAALALKSKTSTQDTESVLQSFSGSHPFVAEYLIREVFDNLSSDIQEFLMQTSFLNRLTGTLCNSVTGNSDGDGMLDRLERENLFLTRLEHGKGLAWYRYNQLFSETIQLLARQRLGAAAIQSVFEKSCDWFASQERYDDAIEAALMARSFERALELIEAFIEIHSTGELFTLKRWLEQVPDALITRHPEICLAFAQVILYTSDRYARATAIQIEPYLDAAEHIWHAIGNIGKVGAISSLRGMILLWQGDLEKAFEYVHRSLEELPEKDILWRGISQLNAGFEALCAGQMFVAQDHILEARALMGASQNLHGELASMQYMSEIFYWQGDSEQFLQLSREILERAVGGDEMLDDQAVARLNLAKADYEQNELDKAYENAAQSLALATKRKNGILQAQASILLSMIDSARGNFNTAQDRLRTFIAGNQKGSTKRELQCAQALLSLRSGESASLEWWQVNVDTAGQKPLLVQRENEALVMACLQIAQGKPASIHELLKPWIEDSARNGRIRSQIQALCIEALAFQAQDDLPHARQMLTQALTIGRPKGFRRMFLDFDQPMAILLQDLIPTLASRPLRLYSSTLLQSFPSGLFLELHSDSEAMVFIEPLSQQELRVLCLIAAGMSNSDISRELVVSTNTVKTHVKNIYRKLNINSRQEAREMARELKLSR